MGNNTRKRNAQTQWFGQRKRRKTNHNHITDIKALTNPKQTKYSLLSCLPLDVAKIFVNRVPVYLLWTLWKIGLHPASLRLNTATEDFILDSFDLDAVITAAAYCTFKTFKKALKRVKRSISDLTSSNYYKTEGIFLAALFRPDTEFARALIADVEKSCGPDSVGVMLAKCFDDKRQFAKLLQSPNNWVINYMNNNTVHFMENAIDKCHHHKTSIHSIVEVMNKKLFKTIFNSTYRWCSKTLYELVLCGKTDIINYIFKKNDNDYMQSLTKAATKHGNIELLERIWLVTHVPMMKRRFINNVLGKLQKGPDELRMVWWVEKILLSSGDNIHNNKERLVRETISTFTIQEIVLNDCIIVMRYLLGHHPYLFRGGGPILDQTLIDIYDLFQYITSIEMCRLLVAAMSRNLKTYV